MVINNNNNKAFSRKQVAVGVLISRKLGIKSIMKLHKSIIMPTAEYEVRKTQECGEPIK
uniref:Uncharacterized protein n=1 Tax=Arundo donax TaxID=35708 RepID=A0A0A8ZSR5_ARUDO